MNCDYVQTWLMQVDSLLVKDWPRDMNRHLKRCAVCAKFARSLYKMEVDWRDQPMPPGCEDAKKRFLKTIDHPTKPIETEAPAAAETETRAKPALHPWHPIRWVGAAAMVLIALGALAYMLFGPSSTQAAPSTLIDRLIDWNVAITNADVERRKELLEEEPTLRRELEKDEALLTLEEHELADELLRSGRWLAQNEDDIVKEAEKIEKISNLLADRAAAAEKKGNELDRDRYAHGYDRFMQYGVYPMQQWKTPLFMKFLAPKGLDFKKGPSDKGGFDKDKGGWDNRDSEKERSDRLTAQKLLLDRIWQRTPDRQRPDLHKKFDGYSKKVGSMFKFGGKR